MFMMMMMIMMMMMMMMMTVGTHEWLIDFHQIWIRVHIHVTA
jgi:hypothetical protein